MKNRLRVLYLSSEVTPFAKTGGLADVANALPKSLFDIGHDVRVMMPKYGPISDRKYTLREVIRLKKIPVRLGNKEHIACAKSAFIPDTKVQIYFLEYKPYFDRPDLYVNSKTGEEYPDNAQRYALFCKAVLETVKLLHWEPQVIHCNDWQTGLVPWLLKNEYKDDPFFAKTGSVFTIHNLAYQGNFKPDVLAESGLPTDLQENASDIEFNGQVSYLKAGLMNSDLITTVSPTYAKEIQNDPEISAGMKGILEKKSSKIYGLLNGIDYDDWNPETDKEIEENYSVNNLKGKSANKKALLKMMNLTFDESVPLIGMVSRLAWQKGFELVAESIDQLMKLNVQLVILGTGSAEYQNMLEKLKEKYPENIAIAIKFDNTLAHLIEAGSDIFLMPSRYEPCGLNQMYSLRYGTVPVVRKTGGLADTVINYENDSNKGNGFVFEAYSSSEMVSAVKNAIEIFKDTKTWQKVVKRGMKQDFSWKSVAENYIKLYSRLDNRNRKK